MKRMIFSGSSDDCRDISGDFCEEEYCDVARVLAPDGSGFCVVWSYSEKVNNACWCIGFQQLDEDVPIPEWVKDVTIGTAPNGYSVQIGMSVPDDVRVEWAADE